MRIDNAVPIGSISIVSCCLLQVLFGPAIMTGMTSRAQCFFPGTSACIYVGSIALMLCTRIHAPEDRDLLIDLGSHSFPLNRVLKRSYVIVSTPNAAELWKRTSGTGYPARARIRSFGDVNTLRHTYDA
ncbi:hypothetical protein EI94DRAFT_884670 [Lactarius quietus]|nr:hypothetical protein EI94DRAFT_884670 [Lactarius quietus]